MKKYLLYFSLSLPPSSLFSSRRTLEIDFGVLVIVYSDIGREQTVDLLVWKGWAPTDGVSCSGGIGQSWWIFLWIEVEKEFLWGQMSTSRNDLVMLDMFHMK